MKTILKDKISLFSGHSGVGKSTLANELQPGLNLQTGSVSESHGQGKHTTTFAEMHFMKFGAHIIDTPGIRGFGLVDMENVEISHFFPEILNFSLNANLVIVNILMSLDARLFARLKIMR